MDDVQFIKDNTIIGKIEGRNVTISEMQQYFNDNTYTEQEYSAWDSLADYGPDDPKSPYKLHPEYRRMTKTLPKEERPEPGTPMIGYRVFTHLEDTSRLGSPVGSNVSAQPDMFSGIPIYSDSVNEEPRGHGFYIFHNKEMAMTYASYMLKNTAHKKFDSGEKIYLSVYKVEGEYVDPNFDPTPGAYGERINFMKTIGDPIIDIEIHKGEMISSDWTLMEYAHFFDILTPIAQRRFYEQNPIAQYHEYDSNHYYADNISHYNKDKVSPAMKNFIEYNRQVHNQKGVMHGDMGPYSKRQALTIQKEFKKEWRQFVQAHPEWMDYLEAYDYLKELPKKFTGYKARAGYYDDI